MKKSFIRMLIVACVLAGVLFATPALAEELQILLNGEPVSEAVLNLTEGNQLQFTASEAVTWKSSKSYRGEIDQNGLLTSKRTGTIIISATAADGEKATCEVQMTRLVSGISISGPTELAGGKRGTLKATVMPSNAGNKKVSWSSSNPEVVSVSSSGRITAKNITEVQSAVITAAAKDGSGVTAQYTVTVEPSAQSISILSGETAVKEVYLDITSSPTLQLSAAVYPAAASQNVSWKSSSKRTVSVDENGMITGLRTGKATITATAQDGTGKKTTVTVRVVRMATGIEITGTQSVLGGKRVTLKATVSPSNATERSVRWTSSDPTVATVDSRGRVTAQKVDGLRSVVITAEAKDGSGVAAQHTITVTPAISSMQFTADEQIVSGTQMIDLTSNPTLDLGMYIQPTDACQEVKWSSSSTRYATVDENGVVTAKKTGKVKITATAQDGSGRKATVTISIVRAVKSIAVSGDTALAAGKTGRLTATASPSNATNKSVTWESSNPDVLTVDKRGRITAKQSDTVQQATVYAKAQDGSGVVGSIVVTVTPRATSVTILKDGQAAKSVGIDLSGANKVQLTAQVGPEAAHQGVKWTTSNKRRATVDQNGVVTGLRDGTATITATATDGTGVKASITVNVGTTVKQVVISGPTEVGSGGEIDLSVRVQPTNATETGVVWSSSDPSLATVNKNGVVTVGVVETPTPVVIYATAADGGGAVGEYTVTVCPYASSIAIKRTDANMANALILNRGAKAYLGASVYPAAASQAVIWSSSNTSVATVSSDGVVTARSSGRASITARAADGSGVTARLMVGVGNVKSMPYYLEVDYANQVVRVYERGADNSYSTLIKRMICSTRLADVGDADYGLYPISNSRMVWMLSEANTYALYGTRIHGTILFHSVPYPTRAMDNLDTAAYGKLGSRASLGCIRLLAADAKWIYESVPQGCFVRMMPGVRDVSEYGAVSVPELKSGNWDPTNPELGNPDFDPTYTSDVK